MSVINAAGTVIATIPVGANPDAVAVCPQTGNVYVTNQVAATVSVINPAGTVINTINVQQGLAFPAEPAGVAVSPTGTAAGDVYVTDVSPNGAVSVITRPAPS